MQKKAVTVLYQRGVYGAPFLFAYNTERKSKAVENTSITIVKIKDDFSEDNIEKHGKSVKITKISLRNLCGFPERNMNMITE